MNRIIIIAAMVIVISGIAGFAADKIYSAGFNEAQRLAAVKAEKDRVTAQTKINTIEKQALEKIATQTASNVEKAVADVRKSNPGCSLTLPSVVLDAIRKR